MKAAAGEMALLAGLAAVALAGPPAAREAALTALVLAAAGLLLAAAGLAALRAAQAAKELARAALQSRGWRPSRWTRR